MEAHRLENMIGSQDVLLEILIRSVPWGELHVRVGSQVIDHLHTSHRATHQVKIQQVALNKVKTRVSKKFLNVLDLPAT